MPKSALLAVQSRMARAALGWNLHEAAEKASVHRNTINNFERGTYAGDPDTIARLRDAYEKGGAVFRATGTAVSVGLLPDHHRCGNQNVRGLSRTG